ncbi:hypothetical protein MJO28_008515 [Puccinia striiformis f. sp. tritici]|nr:hypothetical protein MJO28_008515 [Puccinia striiformis f. sp. tritici]KAI7952781.1 hypothetical protein MJO29_008412 [Puccinia striiformis f. sp. tritici]
MYTHLGVVLLDLVVIVFQALCANPYNGQVFKGQATTDHSPWERGNCLFFGWPQPKGINPIAINAQMWDSSRMCGACIAITNQFGTHMTVVTDQSPVGHTNLNSSRYKMVLNIVDLLENIKVGPTNLDLGEAAWAAVSNHQPSSGIPITWKMVPCNFTAPIQFTNQKGAHPFWTAIQVANSNVPIRSLEARPTDKKSRGWIKLKRNSASNHYGTKCKPIGPSADLRVTCLNGKQIITNNVNLVYSEGQKPTMATGNC